MKVQDMTQRYRKFKRSWGTWYAFDNVTGNSVRWSMNDEMRQAALATWAAKDLPARLLAGQVAKLLNCTTEDVAILVSAGKLRPLGKPRPNAVKFFSSIELITLLANPSWLDEATKTITQHWRRKNAHRNGLRIDSQPHAVIVTGQN